MNTRISKKSLILGIVAGAVIALTVATVSKGQKWEYLIVGGLKNGYNQDIGTTVEALDAAGKEGWEAVTAYPSGVTLMKRPL